MTSPCPHCQANAAHAFQTKDNNRQISSAVFDYYHCTACGLWFLCPIPKDLSRYYPKDYYTIHATLDELAGALSGVRYKIEILRAFAKSGRLLEIGPACGDFALQAKQAGFEVDTIEMDPRCCEFLVKQVGVRATCTADTLGALREAGPYDVIAMWHVIEHLTDALETLAAASARLKPGGVLVIAAPNPEAFQFRILRGWWTHVDAPRHVVLIPLSLLCKHAGQRGLETVLATTDDEGARGWNQFGWERSLGNIVSGNRLRRWMQSMGRFLTRMAMRWDRQEGRGSTYTVVFRKKA
jgi:2-polyprenyl-3-methyl-5-hydroxy-6-metoxy-1,4-benzoquinol methylase